MTNAGGTGTITFDHPAIDVTLHARLSSSAATGSLTVTSFDAANEVIETTTITDASADFRKLEFSGVISRLDVVNTTDQPASIDDFSADTAILVDIVADESDGNLSAGDVSLREAIELANTDDGPDTILFASAAFHPRQTIALDQTLGEFQITAPLTVRGDLSHSETAAVLLDGSDNTRIFNIDDRTSDEIDVTLMHIDLRNGAATGNGGAILSTENLTLTNSRIVDSEASGHGGGIHTQGALSLSDVTLERNTAQNDGGAIYNSGTVTASNLTVRSNNAASGGAVYNSGTAEISDSDIQRNSSSGGAGSVLMNDGTAIIRNTTLENNTNGGGIVNSGDVRVSGVYSYNSTWVRCRKL